MVSQIIPYVGVVVFAVAAALVVRVISRLDRLQRRRRNDARQGHGDMTAE